jgi:hypothetical protein
MYLGAWLCTLALAFPQIPASSFGSTPRVRRIMFVINVMRFVELSGPLARSPALLADSLGNLSEIDLLSAARSAGGLHVDVSPPFVMPDCQELRFG